MIARVTESPARAQVESSHVMDPRQFLASRTAEMQQQIETLCNINSGTYNIAGVERVQNQLIEWFAPLGGDMQRVPSAGQLLIDDQGRTVHQNLGPTLVISKRIERRPRVLLCIHCDTVFGPDHDFQKCRQLDANVLNGPGVIDAKGGLIVMLHALLAFEQSTYAERIGWQVVINADEEIGSPGSVATLHALAREADWGLLFEPTMPDGSMVSWRKGSGNFTLVVRGQAAHAGRDFAKGRNALVALSRLLVAIHELNQPTHPDWGDVTFNVGRVAGGGAVNVVPDLAIGRVNIRVRTAAQQTWAEAQLRRLVGEVSGDGIHVAVHGEFSSPPKEIGKRTEQLQRLIESCAAELGMPIQWNGSGGASDGNKFSSVGLANIDTFGPAGGEIHSDREFLRLDSLVPSAQLAAAVLVRLGDV